MNQPLPDSTAGDPASPEWLPEYEAITAGSGVADFSDRTLIELAGEDRASFLHNLCTSEIRKLAEGSGCETFLTTVQGRTLAHGYVFAEPDRLVIEAAPGLADTILQHLDHYLIREKVTLSNRGSECAELLLAGAKSAALLSEGIGAPLQQGGLASVAASIASLPHRTAPAATSCPTTSFRESLKHSIRKLSGPTKSQRRTRT